MIYLDNAASTAVHPEVVKEMMPYFDTQYGNPSSIHQFGRKAKNAIQKARNQVAALIGAEPDEILFTSGGTESNNTILYGTQKLHEMTHVNFELENNLVLQKIKSQLKLISFEDVSIDPEGYRPGKINVITN